MYFRFVACILVVGLSISCQKISKIHGSNEKSLVTPPISFLSITQSEVSKSSCEKSPDVKCAQSSYFLIVKHQKKEMDACKINYKIERELLENTEPTQYVVKLSYDPSSISDCQIGNLEKPSQTSIEITQEDYHFFLKHIVHWENPKVDSTKVEIDTALFDTYFPPIQLLNLGDRHVEYECAGEGFCPQVMVKEHYVKIYHNNPKWQNCETQDVIIEKKNSNVEKDVVSVKIGFKIDVAENCEVDSTLKHHIFERKIKISKALSEKISKNQVVFENQNLKGINPTVTKIHLASNRNSLLEDEKIKIENIANQINPSVVEEKVNRFPSAKN